MTLMEEVEELAARDGDAKEPGQKVDNRAKYLAKAMVEDFHAKRENRSRRPLDSEPAQKSKANTPPNVEGPTLMELDGIAIKRCALDERGIVEVVCESPDFAFDNPVYLVNPRMLVEDSEGDIERVVGEDESGPVIKRYREDPTQSVFNTLARLRSESQKPHKGGGE